MARGVQFSELVTRLREELGRSNSVAVGVDDKPSLQRAINRNYKTLYDAYDWPFLRQVFPKISLANTQQYYNLPSGLNTERVEVVNVWWNGIPHPIKRGIGFQEYAAFDSTTSVKSDPVLAWDVRTVSGAEQIEVWPIPSSNDQDLQFIGIPTVTDMVNDADQCKIDDEMVILFAAAQILARQKSEDAPLVNQLANARLKQQRSRASGGSATPIRVGLEPADELPSRSRAHISISG